MTPSQPKKTNPIQTQSKPILKRMNVNFCATGYYESKPAICVAGKPTFAVAERQAGRSIFSTRTGVSPWKFNCPRC